MERLLPIGSIIKLDKESKICFMIVGYFPTNKEGDTRDYSAVRYPMGAYDSRVFFFINHKDITEILHEGYKDNSYENLMELIGKGKLRENLNLEQ
ncbi:MAG: DUF4176 domain-containing protein [Lachnospiraceae bacterium]|nr:DUF4176 domain-containing protein [Lachnospiraceae bacterium]